jgi:hypothetical protein
LEEIVRATPALIPLLSSAIIVTAVNAQQASTEKEDDLVLVDGPNFVLPSRVGSFQRGDAQRVDRSGYDFAFSYNLDHLIECDISVHPAGTRGYGTDLNKELQDQQSVIARTSRDVKLISREPTQSIQDDRAVAGLRAGYNLQRSLFTQRNVNCGLQVYVFRDGTWFVVFRFFYPRDRSAIAVKHVRDFVAQWQWRQVPRHIP